MKRKISISTTITLVLLAVALTVSLTMLLAMRHFNDQLKMVGERQGMYEDVHDVDSLVRQYYPNIDDTLLRQSIAQGYVSGLGDPYAVYYTPARYAAEKLRMSGKANNVGVILTLNADAVPVVSRVNNGSSAAKAGVKVGDVVTALDSDTVAGKPLADIQNLLNTAEKVRLTVQRGEETHSYELSSFEYTVRSVTTDVIDNVGYVRITAFYENTPDQFRSAVSALQEKGVTGLVFDLRNNAGGSPQAVQSMLDYVMPLGPYGTMTDVAGNITILSVSDGSLLGVPTVTLVNGTTSGEAEFFAAVLQHASLTTVVGQTTAGKAKYQQYFTLESDYSALKLTVGQYGLVNSKETWQDVGVTPEVLVELPAEQAGMSSLLEPEDDQQVKVAIEQIAGSDMSLLENATTTEPTEKESEETAKKTEKASKKTEKKSTKTTEKK